MAHEKLYTAKQAATAVLEKVGEILKKSESLKADLNKKEWKDENTKKESATPSEHNSKDASEPANGPAPKGEIHPKEHENAPSDEPREQKDPQHNPKEEAEGNNELAGTTPTQVGQDGKNMPGGDEIKGHLKLAKFVGRMDYKRQAKKDQQKVVSQQHVGNSQSESSAQHKESLGKAENNLEKAGMHQMSATQLAAKTGAAHGTGEKWSGGTSSAGEDVRTAGKKFVDAAGKKALMTGAKQVHSDKLSELKGMPAPKLPR